MTQPYPIPSARARAEIEVLRSRFIATAGPVGDSEAAKAMLKEIRAEFPDAAHHVHAFIVGRGGSQVRGMSDDGEPPGTAGRPSMAVVEGSGLGDVCLVTTRYFGGTKLGTGGLVRAYTAAAQAVLELLPRGLKVERRSASLALPYNLYEQAKRLLERAEAEVLAEDFLAEVVVRLRLPQSRWTDLDRDLRELTAGRVGLEPEDSAED